MKNHLVVSLSASTILSPALSLPLAGQAPFAASAPDLPQRQSR